MWPKQPRVLVFLPRIWGLLPFPWVPDFTGATTLMMAVFCPRKTGPFDYIILHLLHSCTQSDLEHSCSLLHKSRDNFTLISFKVGRAMEQSIPKSAGHITRLHGGNYPEDGSKKSSRKPKLFNNVPNRAGSYVFSLELGAFDYFLTTRLHGIDHPDDGRIFPAENRSFSLILLWTYCNLARSAIYTTIAPYSTSHVITSRDLHLT